MPILGTISADRFTDCHGVLPTVSVPRVMEQFMAELMETLLSVRKSCVVLPPVPDEEPVIVSMTVPPPCRVPVNVKLADRSVDPFVLQNAMRRCVSNALVLSVVTAGTAEEIRPNPVDDGVASDLLRYSGIFRHPW